MSLHYYYLVLCSKARYYTSIVGLFFLSHFHSSRAGFCFVPSRPEKSASYQTVHFSLSARDTVMMTEHSQIYLLMKPLKGTEPSYAGGLTYLQLLQ